jgi:excisionase family DNA binding protein
MKKLGRSANVASSPSDEIMTVETLAQYLRCHPSTIYRLLKRGEIPAFKLGSDWRFFKAAIDEWARKSQLAPKH